MLTKDELRNLARRHIQHEYDMAVEQVMETVSAAPCYLIHPAYRVEGRAAVAELYRRTLSHTGHQSFALETMAALDDPLVTTWGPSHFVIEFPKAPHRYPLHADMVLVVQFDGDRVAAERIYVGNPDAVKTLLGFFGPDFASFPGVQAVAPQLP